MVATVQDGAYRRYSYSKITISNNIAVNMQNNYWYNEYMNTK